MKDLKVVTSQERILPFDSKKIIESLVTETGALAPRFFGIQGISEEHATVIARNAEYTLRGLNYPLLTAPLIREIVNSELLMRNMIAYRNIMTRVGAPVFDACSMDIGRGKEDKENANLQDNAETSHKKKADKMSKEQYLLLLPPELSQLHLTGDLHIHDLEYFGTRPFCQDHDLRYFFYYGLMPDGKGTKAAVAGPAKRPEVAVLHAVKALGSAQTNFAGGQGYYNFLTFLAPYLAELPYSSKSKSKMSIKQLMQMFVYEMTQMMVARGGQLVFSSVQLSPGIPKVWKDKPVVAYGKIFDGIHEEKKWTYGELEPVVRLAFKALMEVFLDGDAWGKPFSFPKPEIVLSKEFVDVENDPWVGKRYWSSGITIPSYEELYELVAKLTILYGSPYFDNSLPEYRGAEENKIDCMQCCSYHFSTNPDEDPAFMAKMLFKDGAHFSMGGAQVVTGNLPRAAMRAVDICLDEFQSLEDRPKVLKVFMDEVKKIMDHAMSIYKQKRIWLDQALAADRIPFGTQRPRDPYTGKAGEQLVDFDQLVYAFGIVGMNEVAKILTGYEIGDENETGWTFAMEAVYQMREYCKELTEKHGLHMVLARTPAETVAQRFAALDLDSPIFGATAKQVVNGNIEAALRDVKRTLDVPVYYTNGAMIKMNTPRSLDFQAEREGMFFPLVDGGNIMHVFIADSFPLMSAYFNRQIDLKVKAKTARDEGDIKTARFLEKLVLTERKEDKLLNDWSKDLWSSIKRIAKEYEVGYFAFTRDISICLECSSTIKGSATTCPVCGSTNIDLITRVTGYCQAVSGFNAAKKQEVQDRYRHNEGSIRVVG